MAVTTEQVQDYIIRSQKAACVGLGALDTDFAVACDAIAMMLNNELTIEELREEICRKSK